MYSSSESSDGLAAVLVVIIVAVVAVIGFMKCSGADHRSADVEFRKWAKDLKIQYDGEVCNNHDGDGDGYVSCTYTVGGVPHTVECAGSFNMQHGCREPKVRVPRR